MVLSVIAHWLAVLVMAPCFIGIIARVKAFFAGLTGPSVLQPYFDIVKLLGKRSVYSRNVTWVFRAAPVVALAAALLFALIIPIGILRAPAPFEGDVLLAVYILALSRFFMIAGAMDTGFSLEGLGASREAFFACLGEAALFMNFIALAHLARSLCLSHMIGADMPMAWSLIGPTLLLVVVSLFIVLLAENCRLPVDDPDTHLELTMVHEVMVLEHSGVDLAFMLYAAAIKLFMFAALLVPIIIPVRTGTPATDMMVFIGGMFVLALVVGVIESAMARIRLDRVRHFLVMASALAFFGLIVTLWKA